ncbi:MAG: N-acetylmuramoyl-L-alanine amidase [Thermodesulfobacteriota bacterium]
MTRRQAITLLALSGLIPRTSWAAQGDGQELASKGHDLFVSGRPGEAAAVLREASRLDPSNPWLFNLLGRASYQAGDMRQAAESFAMALRIDPSDGYSRMMLEMLSQRPLPAPKGERGPGKSRKPSQLETEAREELEAFGKSGEAGQGQVIVIDPGHGGADKGVSGASGTAEKDVCLDVALKLASELASTGAVRAVLTRDGDYDVPLWARSAMSGLYAAGLFVSLHCTAAEAGQSGAEAYTYAPGASGPRAHGVAELENGVTRFERRLPPAMPLPGPGEFLGAWRERRMAARSREAAARIAGALGAGTRVESGPLKVLRGCAGPSVLVEMGFLSSQKDEELLASPEGRRGVASRLALALTESRG